VANERCVGIAWARLSCERILGGSVRIARDEHRQHGDLDFPRSRINAVRRLLRVRQRGGAARTDHPTACFQGAEQPTPASVLGSRPARTG
jgi:hypothetical protein